ncbi:DUF411 domain-containing protein [Hydrogenophaga sp.]|uniref:DUF411 domain-containing protein n=1 Tax=Hydrogenophaga sp. TaxID=1904254 RepID=UPI00356AF453
MNASHTTAPPAVSLPRRRLALGLATAALAPGWALAQSRAPKLPVVQVWKDPNCGCCKDWVAHLVENGFPTKTVESGNTAARARLGMPVVLGSCHTALVDGYVLEGHVPAREVRRLLKERPKALGLSVPRMPVGSPGMDGPAYGGRKDAFDVLLVAKDGSTTVYQTYA